MAAAKSALSVLVIEFDDELRAVLVETIDDLGYPVRGAASIDEAVSDTTWEPSIAIVSWTYPEVHHDAVRALHRAFPSIAQMIAMMTPATRMPRTERIDCVLEKPFTTDALRSALAYVH